MSEAATAGHAPEPRHGLRIVVIWALLTIIAVPLIVVVLGPHMPPGGASQEASDQREINTILTALAAPVLLGIWVFFGYSLAVFRHRGPELVDGPPIKGHTRLGIAWLLVTGAMVLGLAAWGTQELFGSTKGAGGGQGPAPLAKPAGVSHALQVQVIGQQWNWTFRYPGYGGIETPHLALPANRLIVLHVTSLDVTHSFWSYELGVKADAVPGNDNVAYVHTRGPRSVQVRCAELCGLWHGHMADTAQVLAPAGFAAWIARAVKTYGPLTKSLPPYAHVYYPEPLTRGS